MRLIDADEIKEKLSTISPLYATDEYDYCTKDILDKVDDLINNQPTAYDVDKVVECLEILSDSADDKIMGEDGSEQYWDGFGDGVDKAIGILKSGGIE